MPPEPGNYGHDDVQQHGLARRSHAPASPDGLPIGVQLIAKPFREDVARSRGLVEAGMAAIRNR
jgi:amidase